MLLWNWDEKCGEMKMGEHSVNLYEGNALMFMIKEEAEKYQIWGFFADKEHAKNRLGLNKGHENAYAGCPWEKITLYRSKSRNWKVFTELAAKAFPDVEIHLLP